MIHCLDFIGDGMMWEEGGGGTREAWCVCVDSLLKRKQGIEGGRLIIFLVLNHRNAHFISVVRGLSKRLKLQK